MHIELSCTFIQLRAPFDMVVMLSMPSFPENRTMVCNRWWIGNNLLLFIKAALGVYKAYRKLSARARFLFKEDLAC